MSSINQLLNLPTSLSMRFSGLIQSLSFSAASHGPVRFDDWSTARDIGPQSVVHRGQVPQGYDQATIDAIRKAQLAIADACATTDVTIARSKGALPPSGAGAPLPKFPDLFGISALQARAIAAQTTPATRIAASPIAGLTASQVQQAINQVELLDLARRTALIEAAEAAMASEFASADDAILARDDLSERFDAELAVCTDDAVRAALLALKLAMFRDLTDRAAYLPRLVTLVLPQPISAVVLAHRLYDDPSYADDIVARNGIGNALFVPAAVPIQVLSNG